MKTKREDVRNIAIIARNEKKDRRLRKSYKRTFSSAVFFSEPPAQHNLMVYPPGNSLSHGDVSTIICKVVAWCIISNCCTANIVVWFQERESILLSP